MVGLLGLFFTDMPDADEALARTGAIPRAGGAGAGTGPALRAKDRRHAPRDRAADQSLRPLEGVRLDDRHRGALAADRPQGRRLRHRGEASLWMLDRRRGRSHLGGTAVNENYEVESVAGGRRGSSWATSSRTKIPSAATRSRQTIRWPPRTRLPRSLGPGRPAHRGRAVIGALVADQQAGSPPRVLPRGRGAAPGPLAPGRAALRNARQHEAEKKVEELDALLAVSREITATLDLDKVMQTVVNATAALIAYDRCGSRSSRRGSCAWVPSRARPRWTARLPRPARMEDAAPVAVSLRHGHRRHPDSRTARSRPTGPRPRKSSAPSFRRRDCGPSTGSS